jgi:hypothetical protein
LLAAAIGSLEMTATTRKVVAGTLLAVVVVLITVFAIQKSKCDDWQSMVRRDAGVLIAPIAGYDEAVESRRPIGCPHVIFRAPHAVAPINKTPSELGTAHDFRPGEHLGKLRTAAGYSNVRELASSLERRGFPCSGLKVSKAISDGKVVATSASCFMKGAEVDLSVGPMPHPFVSFGTHPSWFAIGPGWEVSTGKQMDLAYRIHRLLNGQLWYR